MLNPEGQHPGHIFCDMWQMAQGLRIMPGASVAAGFLRQHIWQIPLALSAFCVGHGWHCHIPASDVDVTGTPCQDFSGCGHGLADQGPQMAIFILWCHLMLSRQTAILVHENVPEFWESLLHAHLGHAYWIFSSVMDCADLGFHLISRKRRYTIMYHKAKCRPVCHPVKLYVFLTETMKTSLGNWESQIWHCFLADDAEISLEVAPAASRVGIPVEVAMQDMTKLLTPGEVSRLQAYTESWVQRFGHHPCHCPWAIFNLRDNPEAGWLTWSAAGGRIPGLRTGTQKLWSPFLRRWLTNKELLAAMGVPVYPQLANAAGVALVAVAPGPDAWHMLGNMMHIASVGTAIFVAMASACPA